jgi:hypothetical protein
MKKKLPGGGKPLCWKNSLIEKQLTGYNTAMMSLSMKK